MTPQTSLDSALDDGPRRRWGLTGVQAVFAIGVVFAVAGIVFPPLSVIAFIALLSAALLAYAELTALTRRTAQLEEQVGRLLADTYDIDPVTHELTPQLRGSPHGSDDPLVE